MTQDKLIHTVHLTTAEQTRLMDEMVTLLNSDTIELADTTVDFLRAMVNMLSASILQCAEMELQYEQAVQLERGEA